MRSKLFALLAITILAGSGIVSARHPENFKNSKSLPPPMVVTEGLVYNPGGQVPGAPWAASTLTPTVLPSEPTASLDPTVQPPTIQPPTIEPTASLDPTVQPPTIEPTASLDPTVQPPTAQPSTAESPEESREWVCAVNQRGNSGQPDNYDWRRRHQLNNQWVDNGDESPCLALKPKPTN